MPLSAPIRSAAPSGSALPRACQPGPLRLTSNPSHPASRQSNAASSSVPCPRVKPLSASSPATQPGSAQPVRSLTIRR